MIVIEVNVSHRNPIVLEKSIKRMNVYILFLNIIEQLDFAMIKALGRVLFVLHTEMPSSSSKMNSVLKYVWAHLLHKFSENVYLLLQSL